jgi:hypothetical protein
VSIRVRALVVALAALWLTACQVEGRVDVIVHDDGSGTVSVAVGLDEEAVERVGDLPGAIPTVDLVDAGWKVSDPSRDGDLTWIEATKPFRSPEELTSVMAEVGMFRDWTLQVTDGFASTSWELDGRIVVNGGLTQFSDSDLASALDGMPLGMTPEELDAAVEESGPIGVTVRVRMPGETDDLTSIPVQLDATTSIDRPVRVTASRTSDGPARWFVVAGVLVALAAGAYVANRLRMQSRSRLRPPSRPRSPSA